MQQALNPGAIGAISVGDAHATAVRAGGCSEPSLRESASIDAYLTRLKSEVEAQVGLG